MRNAGVGGLQDLGFVVGLADAFDVGGPLGNGADGGGGVFGEGVNVAVGETGGAGEDAAGVDAGEAAGFGDGVEDLGVGEAVDGEVVNGFVAALLDWVVGEGGCWDHFVHGS